MVNGAFLNKKKINPPSLQRRYTLIIFFDQFKIEIKLRRHVIEIYFNCH